MKKISILIIALLTIGFVSAISINLSGFFNTKEEAIDYIEQIKLNMELEKNESISSIVYTDDVICKFRELDSDSICFAYFNYTLNNATYQGRVLVNETMKVKDIDEATALFVLGRIDDYYSQINVSYKGIDLNNRNIELTASNKKIKVK